MRVFANIKNFKDIPKVSGIYCLLNLANGKKYVGQASNLRQRMHDHVSCQKRASTTCAIHNALRKYGCERFQLEILAFLPLDQLDETETRFIQECDSVKPNGYNIVPQGGPSRRGFKQSEEACRIKREKAKRGADCNLSTLTEQMARQIVALYKSELHSTIAIAQALNISIGAVAGVLRGTTWRHLNIFVSPEERKRIGAIHKQAHGRAQAAIFAKVKRNLSPAQVSDIRAYAKEGINNRQTSKRIGVTVHDVRAVLIYGTYNDVPEL